jgi:hypothetical protein
VREHPAFGAVGIVTLKALRKDMEALEQARDMFSAYQVDCEQEKALQARIRQKEQATDGQKLEDYKCILGDMQFKDMSKQVNACAPLLFGLLSGLMGPKIERKD